VLFEPNQATGPVRVRHALARDALAVQELYLQLVPPNGVAVRPERIDEITADPNNLLLVADLGGEVVGTALVTFCLDPMYGRQPFGVVENVVVHRERRSLGVGRLLMAAVDRAALDRDCSKLMLLSGRARGEAHAFFRAAGYDGEAKRGFVKYRKALAGTAG